MGTLPDNRSSRSVLEIATTGTGTFTIRYPRRKDLTDVSGALQWSTTFGDWLISGESEGPLTVNFTESIVSDPAENPETLEATGTITGGPASRIFVRLAVE